MKKILAMIMALALAFTMITGVAVLADEPVVAEEPVVTEEQAEVVETPEQGAAVEEELPADFDQESLVNYTIIDLSNKEKPSIKMGYAGTDATLNYIKQEGETMGQTVEFAEYGDRKILILQTAEMTMDELIAQTGIAKIDEKGFFADEVNMCVYFGDPAEYGYAEGETAGGFIFDFGKNIVTVKGADVKGGILLEDIKAGEQNAFIATVYTIKWINVLIALMCLVVIVLIALIVVLAIRKKKLINAEEAEVEFVSEDNLFDVLASEAEETTEEVVEEVAEEVVVEEAAEEKTEE